MVSRVIGYVREAYIAYAFGAGLQTDAYVAAFTLPDWLNYLVAGGTASITFISIFSRYLSQKREAEAQKTFSVILTVMTTVLTVGVVVVAIYARPLERLLFPEFSEAQLDLCVFLTRILLPAQVFFYAGGIVSAVLLSRRMFLIPALGPLFYNVAIIAGGLLLGSRMGVAGLAVGAVVGAFLGPFLVNAIGARRTGIGYSVNFDVRDPAFREWVRLSIPLMLGVSLATADDWILRYFASGEAGAITRLNYAKRLIAVPIAVLGQAAGQASLPFFAKLWGENKLHEFAASVNASIYRITAVCLLATTLLMAAALPMVDLVYRRGRFELADSRQTAIFFFWFAVALALWSVQALYSRAFYAAGNTVTPMIATTLVTLASLPVYWVLFQRFSTTGLAIASDIGITANAVVLAILLHRRRMVLLTDLPWGELGKATVTGVVAGLLAARVSALVPVSESQSSSLAALALAGITWAAAIAVGLWLTRSRLLTDLRRKKQPPGPGNPAEARSAL